MNELWESYVTTRTDSNVYDLSRIQTYFVTVNWFTPEKQLVKLREMK